MSGDLFPSGPWTGFYNYRPGDRHRMDLQLTFANGAVTGDGADDIGRFLVKGHYDAVSRECYWTKTYPGAHEVYYRGFREGKGIWGTWEITIHDHGGFRIWPRGEEGKSEARNPKPERKPKSRNPNVEPATALPQFNDSFPIGFRLSVFGLPSGFAGAPF